MFCRPTLLRYTAIVALATLPASAVIAAPLAPADRVATERGTIAVETLTDELVHPWAVEDMGDGGLLVTERPGRLRIFRDGQLSEPVAGVPDVWDNGQGGLLDIALAADFDQSRTLFLSYSKPGEGGAGTAILKARLSEDETRLEDATDIFVMNRFTSAGHHFGSRIVVADDGTLFFTIGERGDGERAQDASDHAGSVLRINADGSVPADNPHPDGADGWQPEIWSIGHRNPQGLDIDPATGTLYEVEHGAKGGDEVNIPQPGKNYGWPKISYGRHYSGAKIGLGTSAESYEQPLHYWDPSIAPGGMVVYRGDEFPEWDGDLLVTALKFKLLVRLDVDPETGNVTGEERLLENRYGRMRDIQIASDGSLLIVTDEDNGRLLRLTRGDVGVD
jgi:aldose sugar dehydrogenase